MLSELARPRARFHKPAIYFAPAASLKPPERKKQPVLEDEYLPSKVPTAVNLLQYFENDPALMGIHPQLSALRISKMAPTAPVARELVRPIRSGQRRLFRAAPALIWRMRYSKLPSSVNENAVVASLDLEVAPITGCHVTIDDVEVLLQSGQVQLLGDKEAIHALKRPGDQVTCLYKIVPAVAARGSASMGSEAHILTIKITAKASISKGCRADIRMEWKNPVDFSVETGSRIIQPHGKPSGQYPQKAPGPDSLPSHDHQIPHGDNHSQVINVTLTISGPPRVQVGETFRWDVFIVNRSEHARKLAILVIPKRRRDSERHRANPSISSVGARRGDKDKPLASAVLDENIVYAKQKSAKQDPATLLCLTTDVRIG